MHRKILYIFILIALIFAGISVGKVIRNAQSNAIERVYIKDGSPNVMSMESMDTWRIAADSTICYHYPYAANNLSCVYNPAAFRAHP